MSLESDIADAVNALKRGGVVIYPTETLYGLGANIFDKRAVKRVYDLKARDYGKPVSIAVAKENIGKYAHLSGWEARIVEMFLPGPITLVLKKTENVPEWITQGEYVGIRVPEDSVAAELVKGSGPLVCTSANIAMDKEPISVDEIDERLLSCVDAVIDTGETMYGGPSTVVRLEPEFEMLREGVLKLG